MNFWDHSAVASPPAEDELEVSLFGPGYGESVVTHLGQGDWIVVDSCIEQEGNSVVAIRYLEALGVDLNGVRLIVATHWHDDHVRGLASLVDRCTAARFVCSSALRNDEFLTLVSQHPDAMMRSSGVSEFHGILSIMRERRGGSPKVEGPDWALADRPLWRREGSLPASVTALSPSDQDHTLALYQFSGLLPQPGQPKRRLPVLEPNHASVALWLSVGEDHILLGGDLRSSDDPKRGWSAILLSKNRPSGRADVYKVPHHGSKNARCNEVWTRLLSPNPETALTSFVRGNVALPSRSDLDWLCARSSNVYLAGRQTAARKKRASAVERTLREMGANVRNANPPLGHVRLRRFVGGPGSAWKADLFGQAHAVCNTLSGN